MTLFIFRGLPGSGKNYVAEKMAREHGGRIVDRDMIRHMLYQSYWDPECIDEKVVTETQNTLIDEGLRMQENVYVPDMNLRNQYVTRLIEKAIAFGSNWEVVDLTDVDLEVCRWRNATHDRRLVGKVVPDHVIVDLHQRFIKGKEYPLPITFPKPKAVSNRYETYVPDVTKPDAIIIDIDGTLARMVDRGPYDEHLVGNDELIEPVARMAKHASDAGVIPIFMSGRTDGCEEPTGDWLVGKMPWLYDAPDWDLFMRRSVEDRGRPDDDVKYDLFMREVAPHYNVLYTVDDRDKVVAMWRSIGLVCAQVAPGDF